VSQATFSATTTTQVVKFKGCGRKLRIRYTVRAGAVDDEEATYRVRAKMHRTKFRKVNEYSTAIICKVGTH